MDNSQCGFFMEVIERMAFDVANYTCDDEVIWAVHFEPPSDKYAGYIAQLLQSRTLPFKLTYWGTDVGSDDRFIKPFQDNNFTVADATIFWRVLKAR
jgi:hypothetical protein